MKLKLSRKILSSVFAAVIMSAAASMPALADSSSKIDYAQTATSALNKNSYSYVSKTDSSSVEDFYKYNVNYSSSSSSSSSSKHDYYYNTGTSCPKKAAYGKKYKAPSAKDNKSNYKYSLLSSVKKGDIIYEAAGGYGITGHIAIVEGKFYDKQNKKYYIRIIEAIDKGVKRGILDDVRMKEKEVTVLRVKNVNSKKIDKAVAFCKGQLNKKYFLDFKKDTSKNEKDWYCSELVWAGYKNQGINIETTDRFNEPGITPRDILRSNKVYSVFKYK